LDFLFFRGNDFEMFFPWFLFSKGKEDWHKKANNSSKGVKKKVTAYNKKSLDVVFANLNVDIPRTPPIHRGGKKMNKASCRTVCVEATKVTTLVCVDILEVGKDKLSCQGLAQKFTMNENEIIKVLFKKGIATIENPTLD
jgi:hypothetical protein